MFEAIKKNVSKRKKISADVCVDTPADCEKNNKLESSFLARQESESYEEETPSLATTDDSLENGRDLEKTPVAQGGNNAIIDEALGLNKDPQSQTTNGYTSEENDDELDHGISSLQRFTDCITNYICTQGTENVALSPSQTAEHRWMSGGCLCCGQCPSCERSWNGTDNNDTLYICDMDMETIRKAFEQDINDLLALSDDDENVWSDMVCCWLNCDGNEKHKKLTSNATHEFKSILCHNRSRVVNAQGEKIKRLRSQMHFGELTKEAGPTLAIEDESAIRKRSHFPAIKLTKSMDESHHRRERVDNDQSYATSEELISRIFSCEFKDTDYTNQIKIEDLYYDSDPETYNETRHPTSAQIREYHRCKSTTLLLDQPEPWIPLLHDEARDERVKETINIYDPDQVSAYIQELTCSTVTLVWHPSKIRPKNKDLSPVCVQAWFEMGSRLKDRVIQPKFMWRDAYEPDLRKNIITASTTPPHDLELLNIVRVLKPQSINRDEYPFVKLRNCFTLHSNTEEVLMFECTSQQERDRFVHGFKLIVARLASKIIVGDENVFDEFFTPWGQMSSKIMEDGYIGIGYSESEDTSHSTCADTLNSDTSVILNESGSISPGKLHRAFPVSSG